MAVLYIKRPLQKSSPIEIGYYFSSNWIFAEIL